MARLTRHDLKKDELRSTVEELQQFVKQRYREILAVVGILVVVSGSAAGLKAYLDWQEGKANAQLGKALQTFRAYVGSATSETLGPGQQSFPTTEQKYRKALEQFKEIVRRFPHTKAGAIARYHIGVCQAQLGDQGGAIKSLQEAGHASDRNIASLAQLAYAGELAKSGKTEEAVKVYQNLVDDPTSTVPKATALLAIADTYRASRPAQARQIYERVEKEFSTDSSLKGFLTQRVASLPK